MTAKARGARKPQTRGQTYALKRARGTSVPIGVSLDAAWLARLDTLRLAGETRSAWLRRVIAFLERTPEFNE